MAFVIRSSSPPRCETMRYASQVPHADPLAAERRRSGRRPITEATAVYRASDVPFRRSPKECQASDGRAVAGVLGDVAIAAARSLTTIPKSAHRDVDLG